MVNLVSASLDYWLTAGPYCQQFEARMAQFFKAKDCLLVNAGSSANLVMVTTLCAKELAVILKDSDLSPLNPKDEVITPAVTFPTTVAPIIQNQLLPVFVDCELGTYNIQPELIEPAIGPKTRAIFVPHTLGNPCNMDTIMKLADKYKLWVLEDGCDALGATFNGQLVGSFGAMSSLSFYPAHHITMGEGGAVIVNHPRLQKTAQSIRDWGRDCWCDPGISNTCGKRFDWQLGALPCGYDHKYIYSNIGYNLKATDLQAAIGVAQLDKIDFIVARRRQNFQMLLQGLQSLEPYLILPVSDPRSNPSPFGFPVTVRDGISRRQLVSFLEEAKIETRQLFGGNILRQPAFMNIEQRTSGTLINSDKIMSDSFFVGVYPGLTDVMIEYIIDKFQDFFKTAPKLTNRS
jgi:CDP-6-deoxy-D-xylo-4-hexulose-3-dehydrase